MKNALFCNSMHWHIKRTSWGFAVQRQNIKPLKDFLEIKVLYIPKSYRQSAYTLTDTTEHRLTQTMGRKIRDVQTCWHNGVVKCAWLPSLYSCQAVSNLSAVTGTVVGWNFSHPPHRSLPHTHFHHIPPSTTAPVHQRAMCHGCSVSSTSSSSLT